MFRKSILFFFIAISFFYKIIMIFYFPLDEDELAFIRYSYLISQGNIPFIDFFAPGFPLFQILILPLVLLFKKLSVGIFLIKICILFFFYSALFPFYKIIEKVSTHKIAFLTIILLCFSNICFNQNMLIRPSTLSFPLLLYLIYFLINLLKLPEIKSRILLSIKFVHNTTPHPTIEDSLLNFKPIGNFYFFLFLILFSILCTLDLRTLPIVIIFFSYLAINYKFPYHIIYLLPITVFSCIFGILSYIDYNLFFSFINIIVFHIKKEDHTLIYALKECSKDWLVFVCFFIGLLSFLRNNYKKNLFYYSLILMFTVIFITTFFFLRPNTFIILFFPIICFYSSIGVLSVNKSLLSKILRQHLFLIIFYCIIIFNFIFFSLKTIGDPPVLSLKQQMTIINSLLNKNVYVFNLSRFSFNLFNYNTLPFIRIEEDSIYNLIKLNLIQDYYNFIYCILKLYKPDYIIFSLDENHISKEITNYILKQYALEKPYLYKKKSNSDNSEHKQINTISNRIFCKYLIKKTSDLTIIKDLILNKNKS
ncbi:MAG: hypothetical protein ACD_79C00311G0007 [uncultured bacterium]|nr:MAG: hypothetical protein ACD_79C00311G0007 [uncultured bacterium]